MYDWVWMVSYIRTIRRLSIFLVILANFVKVVFIQLPDETRKIAVLEMPGKNGLCEFFALRK